VGRKKEKVLYIKKEYAIDLVKKLVSKSIRTSGAILVCLEIVEWALEKRDGRFRLNRYDTKSFINQSSYPNLKHFEDYVFAMVNAGLVNFDKETKEFIVDTDKIGVTLI